MTVSPPAKSTAVTRSGPTPPITQTRPPTNSAVQASRACVSAGSRRQQQVATLYDQQLFIGRRSSGRETEGWLAETEPPSRRRRDCQFAGIPSPFILKHLLKGEGGAAAE